MEGQTMKAWVVERCCKPEGMVWGEVAIPRPGEGQVLVKVESAALNFLDTLMIQGLYQYKPEPPFTPGVEIAGTIARTGPGSCFRPGQRVVGNIRYGGFAEYAVVDDVMVSAIPDSMGAEEASALPVVYPTSYSALRHSARVQPGEVVLVHAGAGGVGLAAIQLAKAWGCRVVATAGGPEKVGICLQNGADLAIDYLREPWPEKVKEYTGGRGADVIYDPVGGDVTEQSLRCLAWCGRLLIVGFAQGRIPSIPANRLLLKSASAIGVLWGERRRRDPAQGRETFDELFAMYRRAEIKPVVCRSYPMTEAPKALNDLGSRRTYGKVVLIP